MTTIEIRPGEGGDDAKVFAEEICAALAAYARRWKLPFTADRRPASQTITVLSAAPPRTWVWAAGTHRIQRIPVNDRAGRRHTSTATVAVLNMAPPPPVTVAAEDVLVDVYRGSGPGGQHRNKTATAVRLTHVPTGLAVCAEDSRSQWQNRQVAWRRLERHLAGQAQTAAVEAVNRLRRRQVAGAGRPAKMWTWNIQRGTVVCHATGETWPLAAVRRGRFGPPPAARSETSAQRARQNG